MNRRGLLATGLSALALPRPTYATETLRSPLDVLNRSASRKPVVGLQMLLDGADTLPLENFRGRMIVLNVWASWCFQCREELPALSRLQEAVDRSTLSVLPLAIERHGIGAVRTFYGENAIGNLPALLGDAENVSDLFAEWGLPFTILIDTETREFARVIGAARWDDPAFVNWIAAQRAS